MNVKIINILHKYVIKIIIYKCNSQVYGLYTKAEYTYILLKVI